MRRIPNLIVLICVSLLLLSGPARAEQSAQLLVYQVKEKGLPVYISRILVTPDFVRLDEGDPRGGFTLYDRHEKVIYNVSHDDHSVLVIAPQAKLPARPASLQLEVREYDEPDAPSVGGHRPRRYELLANGELCGNLMAVDGLMTGALEGLREMRTTLAYQQGTTLHRLPREANPPCEQADNIFAPNRGLDYGLPLHEWNERQVRELVDFREEFAVSDEAFLLPEGYRRESMPGF